MTEPIRNPRIRASTRSRVPACRVSRSLWLEKTRDTENATPIGSSHNAQRTRSNRYGSLRRGRIPFDRSDSPGRAPARLPLEPRTDAPRALASRSPERTRPKACFYAPSEQRRTDRSPRRLPRARSPQAPGRSSQSSADVGVLRGRSRTPRDAEYVTAPPRPHRRARPEPARFRCQVSRPIPTVRDSTVCYPRVRNGFFASEGHFFLGPRVADGRRHFPPARGQEGAFASGPQIVSSRRRRTSSPIDPRPSARRARARARSPRTPVRDGHVRASRAIELFGHSVSSLLTPTSPLD